MAEGKVRVIIKRPDEEFGHVTNISPSLKNLQKTVGGYIKCVTLHEWDHGGNVHIICNEEGRLDELEHNCEGCGIDFVGTIIVAAANGEGELIDLPISFEIWKNIVLQKEEF